MKGIRARNKGALPYAKGGAPPIPEGAAIHMVAAYDDYDASLLAFDLAKALRVPTNQVRLDVLYHPWPTLFRLRPIIYRVVMLTDSR